MINNIIKKKKILKIGVFELKYRVLNSILKNKRLKPGYRWYLQLKYAKKQRRNSETSLKKTCLLSGRSRSFYGFAKLSRLFLRENSLISQIPGLQKSYW
jgi:small subunit ribosomal protein S14